MISTLITKYRLGRESFATRGANLITSPAAYNAAIANAQASVANALDAPAKHVADIHDLLLSYVSDHTAGVQAQLDSRIEAFKWFASRLCDIIAEKALTSSLISAYDYSPPIYGYSLRLATYLLGHEYVVYNLGIGALQPLSDASFNLENLGVVFVVSLVKEFEFEALKRLADAGFEFEDLGPGSIIRLANGLGVEAFEPLAIAGVNFGNLLPEDVMDIVHEHGIGVLEAVAKVGFKFENIPDSIIVTLFSMFGSEALETLAKVGFKFEDLKNTCITAIAGLVGVKGLIPLKKVNVKFENLDKHDLEHLAQNIRIDVCSYPDKSELSPIKLELLCEAPITSSNVSNEHDTNFILDNVVAIGGVLTDQSIAF